MSSRCTTGALGTGIGANLDYIRKSPTIHAIGKRLHLKALRDAGGTIMMDRTTQLKSAAPGTAIGTVIVPAAMRALNKGKLDRNI